MLDAHPVECRGGFPVAELETILLVIEKKSLVMTMTIFGPWEVHCCTAAVAD
jgi:hypothetical protein